MGVVSLSFTTRCDLIFINIKNNFRIVERIATWRPRAHICVFTDNPRVKSALAPLFGVYCFAPLAEQPTKRRQFEDFLSEYGQDFTNDQTQPERALFLTID